MRIKMIFTHRLCLTRSVYILLMTSQRPDNCDEITWIVISNLLVDINFIHCDIHCRSCKIIMLLFAHLATRCGFIRKTPRGWIQPCASCTQGVVRIHHKVLGWSPHMILVPLVREFHSKRPEGIDRCRAARNKQLTSYINGNRGGEKSVPSEMNMSKPLRTKFLEDSIEKDPRGWIKGLLILLRILTNHINHYLPGMR